MARQPGDSPRGNGETLAIETRVAIVTGASSGIGLATAGLLAEAGARVHALARSRAEGPFEPHSVDVTDQEAVTRLVRAIGDREGIDILVLAAGLQIPDRRLEQLTPESWNDLISTNLSSAFYCVHAAYPYLRRSQGDVVFLSSASGVWPDLSGPAYQAAKLGLIGFARGSGFEEHQNGIRFSTIMPGMTNTPMVDKRPTPVPDEIRSRALRPEDVAQVILFVVSLRKEVYIPEITVLSTRLQALGKPPSAPQTK
jgi:NAD(P)-dependent dehydrogenase (short-subunit alcohol dehydrogenase family)